MNGDATVPAKPRPRPNAESAPFWRATGEHRFLFQTCRGCGHRQFHPRGRCRACHGRDLDWTEAAGTGRLHSFTVVHRPPRPAFQADVPYVLALVDLDEGVRFMAQVRNCAPDDARIDMPVRIAWEDLGDGIALPQVEPC